MAKESTKVIQYDEIITMASNTSGVPKKQLADASEAISKEIENVLEKYQPKKDGDSLTVYTDFGAITSVRMPETIITDSTGSKFTRPSCCAVNMCVRKSYIDSANIGLVDEAAVEKASAKKSA